MTLQEMASNIEAKHDEQCSSYDQCGCLGRLLAAVHGEPDPDGEFYRWPILHYGCVEAPQYTCATLEQTISRRVADQIYAGAAERMRIEFSGLNAWLPK